MGESKVRNNGYCLLGDVIPPIGWVLTPQNIIFKYLEAIVKHRGKIMYLKFHHVGEIIIYVRLILIINSIHT